MAAMCPRIQVGLRATTERAIDTDIGLKPGQKGGAKRWNLPFPQLLSHRRTFTEPKGQAPSHPWQRWHLGGCDCPGGVSVNGSRRCFR